MNGAIVLLWKSGVTETGQDRCTVPVDDSQPMRIAVTGHRPSGLAGADLSTLRARVREVLAMASTSAHSGRPEVLSPLAEGADQLVAREALTAGLALICPLPFDRDTYAADFLSAHTRAEYRALRAAATCVVELDGSRTTAEETEAAYAAVGAWMLDHCDVLLAIWDGHPARGEGGTGQVVGDALARCIPVIWVDAHAPYHVQVLTNGSDGEVVTAGLDRLLERLTARDPLK